MIRVVLADDQSLIRAGLRALIDAEDDMEVVAESADGDQAVAAARRFRPDVVLMDVRMPGTDGLKATERIAEDPDLAGVRVVMLTTFEIDEYVFRALRAGAAGFLLKDADLEEILRALRLVADGGVLLAPTVTRRVVEAFASGPAAEPPDETLVADLTGREREVVALAGRGLSNEEIAARLVISPATARTHVSRAMGKTGVRDRAGLVVVAYEAGLVVPGS